MLLPIGCKGMSDMVGEEWKKSDSGKSGDVEREEEKG